MVTSLFLQPQIVKRMSSLQFVASKEPRQKDIGRRDFGALCNSIHTWTL